MSNTSNLAIPLLTENQSGKVVTLNAAMTVIDGLVDSYDLSTTGGTTVVTEANAQKGIIRVTGTLTSNAIIELPVGMNSGTRLVINKTTGAYTVNVRYGPSGTQSSVLQGASAIVADSWSQGLPSASGSGLTQVLNLSFDGGGSAIPANQKVRLYCPFAFVIEEWTIGADQSGSIVVDIWKDTHANYPPTVADTITASAKPTVTTATKAQSSTLTGWTTQVAAGDWLIFNVDSCTTIQEATLALKIRRN